MPAEVLKHALFSNAEGLLLKPGKKRFYYGVGERG